MYLTYQTVNTTKCVIGIVQRIGQLVHTVVGLTVAIETYTHCDAVERRDTGETRMKPEDNIQGIVSSSVTDCEPLYLQIVDVFPLMKETEQE